MRNYRIIGLTGPTGSGKSALADYFAKNGFKIINADSVARAVTKPHSPCLSALEGAFGKEIINSDGSLNRKALALTAFSSKENTALLNEITHPFICLRVMKLAKEYIEGGFTKIIYDAPQLFESAGEIMCDYVISVLCPIEMRIERITARDSLTPEQARQRISAQYSDEFFIERSDFCVNNNSDLENLYTQADKILEKIREVR